MLGMSGKQWLITSAVVIVGVGGLWYINSKADSGEPIDPNPTIAQINHSMATVDELQIVDLEEGTGAEVKSGDTVVMHYNGTLTDGTKFDSSYDRGKPFETQIGVGQVIAGWDQGVPGMKVGGKRKLTIPSDLAYGNQDIPGIPPGSTLIFEVELISIK